jgi:hypothetical protein
MRLLSSPRLSVCLYARTNSTSEGRILNEFENGQNFTKICCDVNFG